MTVFKLTVMVTKKWYTLLFYYLVIFLFLTNSCSILKPANPHISKNTGNPMEPTRQISRVYPGKRDPKRYLDNNKRKKKVWTKIHQIPGTDCPWDKSFTSSAERKVKNKETKAKRKLKRQIRRER